MIDMHTITEMPYYKIESGYTSEEIIRDDLLLKSIESINKLTRNITIDNCINFSTFNVDHEIDSITLIDLPKYIGPMHLKFKVNENLFILNCNSLSDIICNSLVKRVYIKGCSALKTVKMLNISKELIIQDCENLNNIYVSSAETPERILSVGEECCKEGSNASYMPIISLNNCPKLVNVECQSNIINELIVLNCPLIHFSNIKQVNRIYSDLPIGRF